MIKLHSILTVAALTTLLACNKGTTYKASDVPNDFEGLAAPEPGKGYQIHIQPFPLPANFEREIFVRVALGNEDSIYVNKIESKARTGTHHFLLNNITTDAAILNKYPLPPLNAIVDQNTFNGGLNILSNVFNNGTIYEAGSPEYSLDLPEGYALAIPPKQEYLANAHYYNKTDDMRFGEVFCNLHTLPKSQVQKVLYNDVMGANEGVYIKPNSSLVMTTEQFFEKKTQIMIMIPHYHRRGKKFEVQIAGGPRNGEIVLESYDYVHPNIGFFDTKPLILEKGEGLRTIVTYQNDDNVTVKEGVTSEDEMNLLFFYYLNP
jgi:hypothetical protein